MGEELKQGEIVMPTLTLEPDFTETQPEKPETPAVLMLSLIHISEPTRPY